MAQVGMSAGNINASTNYMVRHCAWVCSLGCKHRVQAYVDTALECIHAQADWTACWSTGAYTPAGRQLQHPRSAARCICCGMLLGLRRQSAGMHRPISLCGARLKAVKHAVCIVP